MTQMKPFATLPGVPREFGFFVGGAWHAADGRGLLNRDSPGWGIEVSRVALCTRADVDEAVVAARRSFNAGHWSRISGTERAAVLLRAAQGIRARAEELAWWETVEAGKPITQSRGEIAGGAEHYEYCAGLAQTLHGESFNTYGERLFGLTVREPVGVVGLINPWNFPFIVLSERLPYILASGNSVVVKPSELTSASTLLMADILKEAGLPDGVYNVVTGTGQEVGQALSEHKDIDVISFTGSTRTGEAVLRASSSNFKKASLELGGKNPQIVFADADLEDAADGVAFGLCFNAGQCCVSGSRLIVEESALGTFTEVLSEKLSRIRVGDCFDPETQMGAIVTREHCAKIQSYVDLGQQEGGSLLVGGATLPINAGGRFFAPTLLGGITNDMRVAREEIFGPVLSVMAFRTEEEAVAISNDSPYGLAASVWSKNIDKALGTIRKVHAGRSWVNTTIAGGVGQPMGGYKQSGIGREAGISGLDEYTEVKSIHIALGKRDHWIR